MLLLINVTTHKSNRLQCEKTERPARLQHDYTEAFMKFSMSLSAKIFKTEEYVWLLHYYFKLDSINTCKTVLHEVFKRYYVRINHSVVHYNQTSNQQSTYLYE
jgi:hypothetical protein